MLPKQAIEEYRKLYQKRFGVLLSDAEASLRANNLVKLYRAVLEPESLTMAQIQDKSSHIS